MKIPFLLIVSKRTNNSLTNRKSIFLPHIQVKKSKFNWPKELRPDQNSLSLIKKMGWTLENQ